MSAKKRASDEEPPRKHILVLDRKPDDLGRLHRYLDQNGYAIVEAQDTPEAMPMLRAGEVDLLVLDASDPEIDGLALCEEVHGDAQTAGVPIIVVTDSKATEDGMTALHCGADDFISRPLRMAPLLVRVRMLLRVKELNDGVLARNEQLKQVNAQLKHVNVERGRVNRELANRNRELEQGMDMAQRLQEVLLPQQYPKLKNVVFSHLYRPADIVGGDLFQITNVGEDRAALFVSDVSGHGIRAALVTAIVKTVFQHVYLEDKNIAQVLSDMNSRFRNVLGPLSAQMFTTGLFLMVDGPQRRLWVSSAGHPPPLLIRKDDMSCTPLMGADQVGPALGFFHSPAYPIVECDLMPGDIVLGFTDGLYEVVNEAGEMFGMERLEELIAANARMIPRDLIQRIVAETDEFRGSRERRDDVCIVTVEIQ
ncbi:MAG: fused response regulator/phosphatase [Candidatus Brocadiia bacterium]|nr:fused response regulator/phosphatase [Candidatus Brocadiia bacterium]